jgi:pimeloyl-ACP methyl ester carboxylesterase
VDVGPGTGPESRRVDPARFQFQDECFPLGNAGQGGIHRHLTISWQGGRGDGRFAHATYSGDLGDIARVVEAVANGALGFPSPTSIGFLGHSRGGGLGVLAAAAEPRIRALVTWAAISDVHRYSPEEVAAWRAQGRIDIVNSRTGQVLPILTDVLDDVVRNGSTLLDIRAAGARLEVPWLIVHGESDVSVPVAEAGALHPPAEPPPSSWWCRTPVTPSRPSIRGTAPRPLRC